MSRNVINAGSFTSIGTTTVNTLYGVEGGSVRFFTGSTTGVEPVTGHLMQPGDSIVVPSGLSVSFYTDSTGVVVTNTLLG